MPEMGPSDGLQRNENDSSAPCIVSTELDKVKVGLSKSTTIRDSWNSPAVAETGLDTTKVAVHAQKTSTRQTRSVGMMEQE